MTNRQNNFYAFSLFCLVPGLGILLAIIFIFFAIFDLKNKTFLIILLILIPVNIGITILTMHTTKNEVWSDEARVGITKSRLNMIKESLEEYKSEKGEYPDSLYQLKKHDPSVVISDDIMHPSTKPMYYYNKKSANKYILFSIGEDGIPFTRDDIFPDTLKPNRYLQTK
jgi:hypothetical protein